MSRILPNGTMEHPESTLRLNTRDNGTPQVPWLATEAKKPWLEHVVTEFGQTRDTDKIVVRQATIETDLKTGNPVMKSMDLCWFIRNKPMEIHQVSPYEWNAYVDYPSAY